MNKTEKKRKDQIPFFECEYCGQLAAHKSYLNHTFGRVPDLIVVTNVETMVCGNCGQSYLEGKALDAVAEVLKQPKKYTERHAVSLAQLAA